MDIATEIALAFLATKILWPLQMPLSRKLTAGFVFLQRLAVIAPIVARLHFLSIVYHSADPTLEATYSTLCKEIQVTCAIVATNIPCFRSFLIATATHYGAPAGGAKSPYGYSAEAGESVNLANLSPNKQSKGSSQQNRTEESGASRRLDFSPQDRNQSVAAVLSSTGERRGAGSSGSGDSRELIIRKDVNYDVQYYDDGARPKVRSESE